MRKQSRKIKRERRHLRTKVAITKDRDRKRLVVFRSLSHTYAQVIDDMSGKTLASASDIELKTEKTVATKEGLKGKCAVAYRVGRLIAEKALKKDIKTVVYDRGGYQYHGRVKALADGAREGGLKF